MPASNVMLYHHDNNVNDGRIELLTPFALLLLLLNEYFLIIDRSENEEEHKGDRVEKGDLLQW